MLLEGKETLQAQWLMVGTSGHIVMFVNALHSQKTPPLDDSLKNITRKKIPKDSFINSLIKHEIKYLYLYISTQ